MRRFYQVFKGKAYDTRSFPHVESNPIRFGKVQVVNSPSTPSNERSSQAQSYVHEDRRSALSEYCGSMGKYG